MIISISGTLILTNHKICIFFALFDLSFLNQWCCCFLQLIKIFSDILFLFIIFPWPAYLLLDLYTDDKILPNKSVLKRCLVAYNSDSFLLSIQWMTTQLVAFENPCLLLEKRMLMPEVYIMIYITTSLFLHQMEAITVCLLSFKYFSTCKKHFYEHTTIYGLSVFSELILWTKEACSFYNKAFHLESKLKHRVFHMACNVSKLRNYEVYPWISPIFSKGIFCHVMGLDHLPTSKYICWIIVELLIMSNFL